MIIQEQNIESAIKQQGIIEIDYVNQIGKRSVLHITSIEKIKNGNILAYCLESQSNLTFKINRIQSINVIEQQGVIEIDYVNQTGEHTILHISDIENKKDGNILAYCVESQSDQTIKIKNIHRIKWVWKFIFDQEDVAQRKGLYVFACRGDNHLEFEPYLLEEGERFGKFFEGKYAHGSLLMPNEPIAFHYIEPYSVESSDWAPYEPMKEHMFQLCAISTDSGIEYVIRKRQFVYCNPTLNEEKIPIFTDDEKENCKNVNAVHDFIEFDEGDHRLFWTAFHKLQKNNK